MRVYTEKCSVQRITNFDGAYFFGYYDKCPWNESGQYILAHKANFMRRSPTPNDSVEVGIIDLYNNFHWKPITKTSAWNWQQGSMLQWLPSNYHDVINTNNCFIFNQSNSDYFYSEIFNLDCQRINHFEYPVYAISKDFRYTLSLDFKTLGKMRPGYGYQTQNGNKNKICSDKNPSKILLYNNLNKKLEFTISLNDIISSFSDKSTDEKSHWFNHLEFNDCGDHFIFLDRWRNTEGFLKSRLFTSSLDGFKVNLLSSGDNVVSHFCWKDNNNILVWTSFNNTQGFYVINIKNHELKLIAKNILTRDGHCSFSPNKEWLLTDTYPCKTNNRRQIFLYHLSSEILFQIGEFFSSPDITGEIRCDLHPRWNGEGTAICIDSIHEGLRQIYIIDVTSIVN